MKLLFLACLIPKTGNCTTADRIRKHIEAAGHTCVLKEATAFRNPSEVVDKIAEENFDAAIAIHIYKGGRFLPDSGIPYGVIFGGTDINEDIKDESKREVMKRVLQGARFAVAFTDKMKTAVETYWPFTKNKIHVQPQGIVTRPSASLNWKAFLESTAREKNVTPAPTLTAVSVSQIRTMTKARQSNTFITHVCTWPHNNVVTWSSRDFTTSGCKNL